MKPFYRPGHRLILIFAAFFIHISIYAEPPPTLPNYLKRWLYYEQELIDRTVDETKSVAPTIENQEIQYRPESKNWFTVESIWIPDDSLNIAQLTTSEFLNGEFTKEIDGISHHRLFIHPESKKFYTDLIQRYPKGEPILVTPTASSRTLLAYNKGKFFFLKLSLDVNLGGIVRTIPKGEVVRSVGISKFVQNHPFLSGQFETLRESMGIIPKGWARGGQILREIPKSAFKNQGDLIPLFSLYAKRDGKSTLLEDMLKNANIKTSQEAQIYVQEKIIKPFIKTWANWVVNGPVVMEAHAQNVLIQVDQNGQPTGKYYLRDFGGFNIDQKYLSEEQKAELPFFEALESDYHLQFSADAIQDSLDVYYEGGFVRNLNIELKRLFPSGSFDLYKATKKMLLESLQIPENSYLYYHTDSNSFYEQLLPHIEKIKKKRFKNTPDSICNLLLMINELY